MAAIIHNFKSVVAKVPVPRLPQKLKGGRIEKWADYWVNLSVDYRDSFKTIGQQMRDNPAKASVYISAVVFGIHSCRTNPNERDLRNSLVDNLNGVAMMSPAQRSPTANAKLCHIVDCFNNDTLRYQSLGLFSIVWEDNYNSDCAAYKATVGHLKPKYATFLQERVLDVGFLGKWWYSSQLLGQVDVNELEWDSNDRRRKQFDEDKKSLI